MEEPWRCGPVCSQLLRLLCLMLLSCWPAEAAYCSPRQLTEGLRFTKDLQTLAIGCENRIVKLHCCATGYTSLIWQQYDKEISKWVLWSDYAKTDSRNMREENQTFVIDAYLGKRDQGLYRCVVTNRDKPPKTIINEVKLQTEVCYKWQEKPRVLLPVKTKLLQLQGYNISVPCQGFFGLCDQSKPFYCRRNRILWFRKEENVNSSTGYLYTRVSKQPSDRVYQADASNGEIAYMTSLLYINNIEPDDYGTYECQLLNRKDRSVVNVTLSEGSESPIIKEEIYTPNWRNTGIILATLVVMTVLVVTVYYNYRFEIRLYIRRLISRPPKDGLLYDAFLLYNDDSETDRQFVLNKLYPYLVDKCHYTICRAEMDFLPGTVRAECYVHAVDMSRAVILVTSPDLISHEWCEFAFHYAITQAKRDMIFLAYRPIPSDYWNEHQRALKAANRMGRKIMWPKKLNQRKLSHFWAQLRYYLPLPKSQEQLSSAFPNIVSHTNQCMSSDDLQETKTEKSQQNGIYSISGTKL